jgi:predicted DsbA family dithiol-disulfide isomerase
MDIFNEPYMAWQRASKALDEADKALEATPEWKAKEEAWKLVQATPEYKAFKKADKALEATPEYKAKEGAGMKCWAAKEAVKATKALGAKKAVEAAFAPTVGLI